MKTTDDLGATGVDPVYGDGLIDLGKAFSPIGALSVPTANGGSGGLANSVYFTAGVSDEAHGLFGQITAVPEPASWALMLVGFGVLGAGLRTRRLSSSPSWGGSTQA